MYLSVSQGFNTPLLYTAQIAARSVGGNYIEQLTNSISFIHTFLHEKLTEPCLSIVITHLSIVHVFGLHNLHTFANPAFQQRKIFVQLFHCDFRIVLCGRNLCMPQNLAYAFYRHPVRYGHHCIRMATHVESEPLVYGTFLRYFFQLHIRPCVAEHIKQPFPFAERFVTVDYLAGAFQQFYTEWDTRLLAHL